MSATAQIPTLLHVAVRKNGLDDASPWWQWLYFRLIWRPFLRFSFRVFKIPPPARLESDGSFSFIEGVGIAPDDETAALMCKDEFYRVKPLPFNAALPRESVRFGHDTWPRLPEPLQRQEAPFDAVPCSDLCSHVKGVEAAIEQADRIRQKVKAASI